MNTTLIGPVELLKSSWAFYKSHWKMLIEIVAWPFIAFYLGNIFLELDAQRDSAVLAVAGVIIAIIAVIFFIAGANGLVSAINKLSGGESKVGIAAQYRVGFSFFWPLVLIAIMRGLASFGSMALFVIPGIFFSIYSIFAMFCLIVDGKRGFSAFVESFSLVHHRWWKTLGRILFLALAYMVSAFVIQGIDAIIRALAGYEAMSVAHTVVSGALSTLMVLAFAPFAVIYLYNLFVDLKRNKTTTEIQEKVFKHWMVAFMVIGAIVLALLPIAAGIGAVSKEVLNDKDGFKITVTKTPDVQQITVTKTPADDR